MWVRRTIGSLSRPSIETHANGRGSRLAHWLSTVVFPKPAGATRVTSGTDDAPRRRFTRAVRTTLPGRGTGIWIFVSTKSNRGSGGSGASPRGAGRLGRGRYAELKARRSGRHATALPPAPGFDFPPIRPPSIQWPAGGGNDARTRLRASARRHAPPPAFGQHHAGDGTRAAASHARDPRHHPNRTIRPEARAAVGASTRLRGCSRRPSGPDERGRDRPHGMMVRPSPSLGWLTEMPRSSETGPDRRQRVVILGGGFAGVGAARKLKHADADVVLVDKHDYHTFQPLLYQCRHRPARDHRGRPLAARPRARPGERHRPSGDRRRRVDLDAREVQFADLEPLTYDYLVFGLGAEVELLRHRGAAEHGFPMYTLPDALRLKNHVLQRWEEADRHPELVDDGALNIVVVGGGATGVESAGALAELYRGDVRKGLPARAPGQGAGHPRRGRARALLDVQGRHPRLHGEGAREAERRGDRRRVP